VAIKALVYTLLALGGLATVGYGTTRIFVSNGLPLAGAEGRANDEALAALERVRLSCLDQPTYRLLIPRLQAVEVRPSAGTCPGRQVLSGDREVVLRGYTWFAIPAETYRVSCDEIDCGRGGTDK
jgi:hypothetical protein